MGDKRAVIVVVGAWYRYWGVVPLINFVVEVGNRIFDAEDIHQLLGECTSNGPESS